MVEGQYPATIGEPTASSLTKTMNWPLLKAGISKQDEKNCSQQNLNAKSKMTQITFFAQSHELGLLPQERLTTVHQHVVNASSKEKRGYLSTPELKSLCLRFAHKEHHSQIQIEQPSFTSICACMKEANSFLYGQVHV